MITLKRKTIANGAAVITLQRADALELAETRGPVLTSLTADQADRLIVDLADAEDGGVTATRREIAPEEADACQRLLAAPSKSISRRRALLKVDAHIYLMRLNGGGGYDFLLVDEDGSVVRLTHLPEGGWDIVALEGR